MEHSTLLKDYQCINCGMQIGEKILNLKDHYLTGEEYLLVKCKSCQLLQTHPRPPHERMGFYYASEKYISHSAKHESLFSKVYGLVQTINFSSKYRFTIQGRGIGSILDIGCGNGAMLNHFVRKGWTGIGIEPGESARNIAKSEYSLNVYDETKLSEFEDKSFDVITLWHVLEHVYNLHERLSEIKRLLKANGTLVLALPNPCSFDAQFYKEYWAAYDVPRHLYHFTPDTIERIVGGYGLNLQDTRTLWFDSYYVSLLSEKYRGSGLFGKIRAIVIGGYSNMISFVKGNRGSSQMYMFKF